MTPDPLIGQVLKRKYRIRALIGRGGYGTVYLATLPNQTPVAIKVLDPFLAGNVSEVQRFFNDYRVLYQLRHPNIVAVRDYGLDQGRYFFVMKYYNGGPLSNQLENHKRLHLITACRIISQVAAGLDAAHRIGVIHRDVKPPNVLLEKNAYAALSDFGIAKKMYDIQQQSGRTLPNQRLGSPYFMSPEQAQGHELNAASDVYSLGVMAFEMLTGWLPFYRGDDLAIMYAQVHEPPPSIRSFDPSLPPETDRVIAWALSKDPQARPFQASLFASSLAATVNVRKSQVIRPIQIPTGKQNARTPPPQPVSKPWAPGWLIALLIVLVIVIGVGMVVLSVSAQPSPAPYPASATPNWGDNALALAVQSGADYDVAIWSDGQLQPIAMPGTNETRPVWAPDGQRLAFVSNRNGGANHIYLMDLATHVPIALASSAAEDSGPSWSPDGKQLAFDSTRAGNSDIWVVNADGTHLRALTSEKSFEGDPAWSPRGDQIAFTSDRDGTYQIYLIDTVGRVQYRLTSGARNNRHAAWSSDGTQIAFECEQSSGRSAICAINADATGWRTLISDAADNRQPAWSADGQWLAYAHVVKQHPTIYVARRDGSQAVPLTSLSGDAQMPDWRPQAQSKPPAR